jgi:hypothetical protein
MSEKTKGDFLAPEPTQIGDIIEGAHDAVFGEITEDGPNYRAVRCTHSPILIYPPLNCSLTILVGLCR